METSAKQRRPRAVKTITGTSSLHGGRPFNYDQRLGNKTLGDTANENRSDDDVIICDDGVSDVVREDLEKALRPVSQTTATSSAARSSTTVSSVGRAIPNLVIEGVRKITRSEFEEVSADGERRGNKLQKAGPKAASLGEPKNDDDSSDSDIEIIKEIPRVCPRSTSDSAPVDASALKSPPPNSEPPFVMPGAVNVAASSHIGLRSLAPRPSMPPPRPSMPAPALRPMPPLVRQPGPPPSRLLLPPPQPRPPPPPLIQRLIPARVPQPTIGQQQPRVQGQPPRAPAPLPPQFTIRTSTPIQRLPAPPLASPISVSTFQIPSRLEFRPHISSDKRNFPGTVAPNVLIRMNHPGAHSQLGMQKPVVGATSVAHVTATAPIFVPRLGDEKLPVFGQNYTGLRRRTELQASFYQRPADNLRNRLIKLTPTKATPYSASSAADVISEGKARGTKRRLSVSRNVHGSFVPRQVRVKFPEGYYGRMHPVPYRPGFNDGPTFDVLFQCDGCKEIFVNNISYVNHMVSHTLHPNSEDEMLGDQTRCVSCWREFQDPFILENHREQVHSKCAAANVCHICELNFGDDAAVRSHMTEKHAHGCEMPYACKPCRYRSSLFEDIWNHYLLEHKNSVLLMCPLCLYMVEAGVSSNKYNVSLETANTNNFAAHMRKHADKMSKFCCDQCKLQFVNQSDLNNHWKAFHRQLRQAEISASKTNSGILALKWHESRPLTEVESDGQCLVSRRLQNETPIRPRFTVAEADCIECGRAMDKRNHYSKLPRKCSDCLYTTFCVASFNIHRATVHRDQTLPPLPFEYSLVPKKHVAVFEKPVQCACGYEDLFGNSLATHLSICSAADGCTKLKQAPETPQVQSLPLMSQKIMAALKLRPSRPAESAQQISQRNAEPTPAPVRREPQKSGKEAKVKIPDPVEMGRRARDLEQRMKRTWKESSSKFSWPNVGKFLKLVQNPSSASAWDADTTAAHAPTTSQDQSSTSYGSPPDECTVKDNEESTHGTPMESPRSREPTTPTSTPSRPRLLSPQMALKRFSQASIPDDDIPSPQRLGQKNAPKARAPIKPSKLGPRLFKQYEELGRRTTMLEAGIDGACELFAQMVNERSEANQKSADDLFNILQTVEVSDTLEEKAETKKTRKRSKRK